jgi:2-amino-4-hydroxy-6-hydroxymethyldihydropteridine diphosphokinase
MPMGTRALIGLGSNLGDRKAILDSALAALGATPNMTVVAVSSYHETAPVGGPPGQGPFLNAAAAIDTTLDLGAFYERLKAIESEAGRVREVRWGARSLDLDVLMFGDCIRRSVPAANPVFGSEAASITVPHPRMALRRFVLAPLAEIAADTAHPVLKRTIPDLLANLDRRPSVVALDLTGWRWIANYDAGEQIARRIVSQLRGAELAIEVSNQAALAQANGATSREAFEAWLEDREKELVSQDWEACPGSGRWLVCDLNFVITCRIAPAVLPGDRWSAFLRRVTGDGSQPLDPTFVVWPLSHVEPERIHSRSFAIGKRAPILELSSSALDRSVEEILTTCAATRT